MTGNTEDEALLLRQLQETVDLDPDNSSHHYNLGLFLWEKGEQRKGFKEKAVEHFVVSAKLNPNNGDAFRLLGHYYSRVSLDTQRALKCYQRAATLNPDDFEAGEALCDLLDVEGKEILEVSVCREASEKSPRAFWAFRRLGYMQAHQKKWSEAVPSLQHAIRGYPTCADLWEALGLAYQRLGMFTAAIKSYGRAIELEDSRVYALIESGNVLLMLGSFRKGVEHFRRALEISPCNLAAHFGLASALLGLSKECISFGAFGWGASLLEEASNVVSASTCLAGNIPSVWKLHGDIQITYAKCFPWMNEGQGLAIDDEAFKASVLSWKRKCYLAAVSATNYYQRALHLAPWEANIYKDIAIAEDLICSFEGDKHDPVAWQLPEKMSMGGLLFEGNNSEFWVALGCLSRQSSLKQHAFIRGLQLDLSLAVAWAYLGKLYRKEDEKQLARQAFDRARSIDPSLSLSWAGMSIDTHPGGHTPDEAFESCLRAVQILPLAEFQIGLTKLAVLSGNLLTSQVYGAIQQAVQRAPHSPESHNLNGLACEARYDYLSAANSYRFARSAVRTISSTTQPRSLLVDISVNLARSLCWAGNASDAARECEDLNNAGQLDARGLHIYAISLWKLGKNDLALSMIRNLAAIVPNMEKSLGAASISLICKLLYCISGLDSAVASILRMPRELMQSAKISYIVSVVHALDDSNRLEAVVSSAWSSLTSHGEFIEMHSLMAFIKLVRHGSGNVLGIQNGVYHLRKALHKYPNSNLLRNLLGYLLLCSKEWKDSHTAIGCFIMDRLDCPSKKGFKSSYEIFGGAAVSCYSNGTCNHKFSFPTCKGRCVHGAEVIKEMQKWLHQEPWNHNAKYLLVLVTHQKAREGRFPRHACFTIERLIHSALSNKSYSETDISYQYKKFQLLLCASEISLQGGNYSSCVNHAKDASGLTLPDNYLFFAHLLLCRAYAAQGDFLNLQKEYVKCLQLKSNYQVGWICLKFLEVQYRLNIDSNIIDLNFEECLKEIKGSSCMWTAIFDLVLAQISIWDQDFLGAEEALARALSVSGAESCLLLCHGAICMELCRQRCGSKFLSLAVSSLTKAQEISLIPLPIVSALIAQAEASLGDRANWERNLRLEWSSWPPDMRPAELYFQMYLLSKQSKAGPNFFIQRGILPGPTEMDSSSNPFESLLFKILESSSSGVLDGVQ